MALLLLGVHLTGDGNAGTAARYTDPAAPAAGAIFGGQREGLPPCEMRGRLPERAAEDLLDLRHYLAPRRELSGLVEQQRLFSRLR